MSNPLFKNQPEDQSLLQPTKFRLTFPRLPNTTFFCQAVALPSVSTSAAMQPTPFVDRKLPGDKLVYDDLVCTILLDKKMQVYTELYQWIAGATFPHSFEEYKGLASLSEMMKDSDRPQYSDAFVTILTNAHNPYMTFIFRDAFPIALGSIMFNTSDTPESTMTLDVTFAYSLFDIEMVAPV